MSDEPSCSNVLDPQLPRCAWLLACSVSRKDASPQSSASARRIPVSILSGNGVHRFRNHCSTSPEYAIDSIDATIAFNGGGRWFIDDVSHSIEVKHKNPAAARKEVDDFKGFTEHVLHSKPFELDVSGHGYHWWQQMLSIDQLDTLKKVKSPLLIVQGGMDTSVSPQKTDELVQRLKELGKNNIEYRRYEALDHGLKDSDGKSLRKEVIRDINIWLRSKLGNPANKSSDN